MHLYIKLYKMIDILKTAAITMFKKQHNEQGLHFENFSHMEILRYRDQTVIMTMLQ